MGRGSSFKVSIPAGKSHLPADRIDAGRAQTSHSQGTQAFVHEALQWLPGEAERQGQEAIELVTPPNLPCPAAADTRRILLADDNADMRDYVRRLLSRNGYEVETAADGLSALSAARANKPHLVLADIMMPGLDGFELLHALREEEELGDVPIILLSARAGEEARIEGMRAGADDYLTKPFSARELVARVESHLKMARLRHDAAEALRLRTAQFETLFNQAPLGVYLVDADFRIREVNPIALPVFGDIRGGVIGRDFDEIMHILWKKDYADEIVGRFRQTLETGESYIAPDQADYRADRDLTEYYDWRLDRILLPEGRFGVVCYLIYARR